MIKQLQVRALGQEYKFRKAKENVRPISPTHMLIVNPVVRTMGKKEVYVTELVWPSEAILYSCSLLKTIQKNRLKEAHFIFIFLIVIAYLMN